MIGKGARRNNPRTADKHGTIEHVPPRETLDGNSAAKGMRNDVRERNPEFCKRTKRPIRVISDRPCSRQRLCPAEAREIERGHAIFLRKVSNLRSKALFARQIAVQKDNVLAFPLLKI